MKTRTQTAFFGSAFLAFFLFFQSLAFGQNAAETPAPRTIFETLLAAPSAKITIELDLKNLVANKRKNDYQRARFVFGDSEKKWEIEVRSRGKFRRKTCDFPPIKIKFTDEQLLAAGLDTAHNDFKIVTHCKDSNASDQLLMREFLAYKLLEKVSPTAMRALLVEIKYVDLRDKSLIINRLGIVLEDDAELADRIGGDIVDGLYNMPYDSLQLSAAANLVLFEYMVGNTDWSIRANRNVMFIRPRNGGKLIVSPYDFDFSGLVNAPYAKPSSESKKRKVRDRFWMGEGLDPEATRRASSNFKRSKNALFETISSFEKLPKKQRDDMINFLKSFFSELDKMDGLPHN